MRGKTLCSVTFKSNKALAGKCFLISIFILVIVAGTCFCQSNGDYQTNSATVSWTTPANWQKRIAGAWAASPDYPGQNAGAGTVWIQGGTVVNLNTNPANSLGAITFNAGTNSTLNISTFILNVSGTINYGIPTTNNNEIINITSGTITCGSILMPVLPAIQTTQLNIGTGTVSVAGSITTNTALKNTITFSGAGTLNIAGNFTGGGTFTCNASTVNYNGNAGSQAIASYIYYNLSCSNSSLRTTSGLITVNNNCSALGSILTLGANLLVNGQLTLSNGSIDISNNDLILGTSATISGSFGSSSMIITSGTGSLKKTGNSTTDFIMTYPIGSAGNYNPMVITSLTATILSGAFITVHAIPIQRMPSTSALNKYWSIQTSNITTNSVSLNFTYRATEIVGIESNYAVKRFDGSVFQNPEGSLINTVTKTLSAAGSTILSGDWTAMDPNGVNTTVDGASTVYPGRVQVYTIISGNTNYVWNITGGVISSGQGTNSIIVTWNNTTGTGSLSVNYAQNGFPVSIPSLTITRQAFPFSCFHYERKIDIKGSMVSSGTLSNFPVMVNLTDATLKSASNGGHMAHNAAYDIYFTSDAAGTQPLEYQLDYYNQATGQLIAWVKIASLTTSNTSIYLFYGNYATTFDASTDDVWGTDYVGVYHLGQDLKDFGLGCNDGINVGTSIVTGKIGDGRQFTRSEKDFIQLTNEPAFNFGSQMSISFWISLNSYPTAAGGGNDWMDYITKGDNKNFRFVGNRLAATPNCKNMWYCFGNAGNDLTSACNSIPANSTWIHIAGTYDGSLPLRNLFINGVKTTQNTGLLSSIQNYLVDNSPVLLGINTQAQDTRAFDGIMDELKISTQFKSDSWIITEYRNQSDLTNVALSGTGEQVLPLSSPATGGSATATPASLFAREYSVLTLSGFTGTSIQWQSSPDNINFTDMTGKTNNPQQTDPLLSTTYFRAMVNNGGCNTASLSAIIAVTPPFISCSIGKRKKITISNTSYVGSDDLVNFPFLLKISNDADLKQIPAGKVQSVKGWDIRFTSADGLTLLPQQVESYDPVTGSLLVWIQIPLIYASQNTDFYMYYGDAAYAGSDPTISAVFGSEYTGVYHMGTGTGKTLFELNDASVKGNNAVNSGTTNMAAGKIGAASIFNGTSQYITLPNESQFEIPNYGKQTLSAWVYINAYSASLYAKYLDKGSGSWTLRRDNGSVRVENRQDYQTPEFLSAINTSGIAVSGWHYLVSTYDHEVNTMVVYIDGSSAASSKNVPANQIIQNNTNQVRIGADAGGVIASFFGGDMDEVRIQNVARSADWIKFEYDNMNNPLGFAIISAETSCNLGAPSPGTATSPKTTLCIGQSTTITLTGYTGGIYWQKSTDNLNWTYITGANNVTLNTGIITKSTYYRASVSNCCEAFSNIIHIIYVATLPPALSLTPNDVLCSGQNSGSVTLTVAQGSGTYGYNWSNSAITQNISFLPASTYAVMVTDLGTACTETGQATLIEENSPPSTTLIYHD